MSKLSITAGVVESVIPTGPTHTVFTVIGTSTAGLSSTVQVRVTLEPIGQIGLYWLLVTLTEYGTGTETHELA